MRPRSAGAGTGRACRAGAEPGTQGRQHRLHRRRGLGVDGLDGFDVPGQGRFQRAAVHAVAAAGRGARTGGAGRARAARLSGDGQPASVPDQGRLAAERVGMAADAVVFDDVATAGAADAGLGAERLSERAGRVDERVDQHDGRARRRDGVPRRAAEPSPGAAAAGGGDRRAASRRRDGLGDQRATNAERRNRGRPKWSVDTSRGRGGRVE